MTNNAFVVKKRFFPYKILNILNIYRDLLSDYYKTPEDKFRQ